MDGAGSSTVPGALPSRIRRLQKTETETETRNEEALTSDGLLEAFCVEANEIFQVEKV